MIMPSWAGLILAQLLMEQFDTLPLQYRHFEHMHEGVWFNFFFSYENFFPPNMALVYA